MNIEQIKIEGLFEDQNYNIKLVDNKLILVAENGSGKTTIVNLIYYFLSKQWTKLLKYNFDKISVKIDDRTFSLSRKDIDILSSEKIKRFLRRYPPAVVTRINDFVLNTDISDIYRSPYKAEQWSERIGLPSSLLFEVMNIINNEQLTIFGDLTVTKNSDFSNMIDCQILYLPTFRRIEQDLKAIFPDLESDIDKYKKKKRNIRINDELSYIELVEFGMEDVEDKIKSKLYEIRENLNNKIKNNLTGGYLKDIINRTYKNISYEQIQTFRDSSLNYILHRIDESVLSKNEKGRLLDFVKKINEMESIEEDETKIIAYFIYRLLSIYNELKKEESDVERFISVCNEYSGNKEFIYDNINFTINVRPRKHGRIMKKEIIELKDLSSGEKQIVSLFSHLCLSQQKNFFIVIDEPELSLSVPWQQRFLVDVVNNPYCKGLLAVTHSPFIFENELENYTHSLNEFSY